MNIINLLGYLADDLLGLVLSLVIVEIALFMIYKLLGGLKWILLFISIVTACALYDNYPTFIIILCSIIVGLNIISKFLCKCAHCGCTISDKNTKKCLNCGITTLKH